MNTFRMPGEPPPGPEQYLDLTWEMFGELCRALAMRVARDYQAEVVVGIARAGVIPAGIVASVLETDLFTLTISRREADGEVRDTPELFSQAPRAAHGRRVLIVDEITSSGDTLRLALAAVRESGAAEVRTATSFSRPGGYRPDYMALETDQTLIFPWDRKVLRDGEMMINPRYEGVIDD